MPIKDIPAEARPREKLLSRGPGALSDVELLAILLRTGIQGKGVLQMAEELLQLKNLKVLRLNACGTIDNLDFLENFPNLIDFRFVDTNILDGNLKPILEHPTIRTVGFLNKKHYNYKDEKIKLELENKFKNDYKTIVHKGEYSTFRYDYE